MEPEDLKAEIAVLNRQIELLITELVKRERIIRILNSRLRGKREDQPRQQLRLEFK